MSERIFRIRNDPRRRSGYCINPLLDQPFVSGSSNTSFTPPNVALRRAGLVVGRGRRRVHNSDEFNRRERGLPVIGERAAGKKKSRAFPALIACLFATS